MLRDLKRMHAELLAGIGRLEAVVVGSSPDPETLSRLRLDLIRISTERHEFIENTIFPTLIDALPNELGERFGNLRTATKRLRAASATHVDHWTAETIRSELAAYRRASDAIRRSMRARIAEETAVLYPLLERLAALTDDTTATE